MRNTFICAAALALAACDTQEPPQGGGQFGQETDDGYRCVEISRTPLAADEASPLGFSPSELTGWAVTVHEATVTWSDGSTAALTLELSDAGEADYAEYQAEQTSSGDGSEPDTLMDIAIDCPAQVEIPLTLSLRTDDGAFEESLSWTLEATSAEMFSLWLDLEDMALSGSFDPSDWATESFDEVWANMSIEVWQEDGLEGEISGYGEATDPGTGDMDGTVSLSMFEIASIAGPPAGAD